LFDLVADIASYDEFLPWVVAVRIRSSSENETVADLVVGFNAFKERFTSRVQKERPKRICVDYIEGPLKYLHNEWRFEPAGDGGTNVHFSVDFAFKSRLFETLAGQMFDRALRRMIGAFETRAAALYGISRSSAQSAA
jgi:coenzyme Q-binding protein COQ10